MSKNVPKLRFAGFSEKWEEIKLGDFGEFTGGGTPSTRNPDFWNGNIPWISSSDLILDDIKNIKISRFISDDAISSSATKLIEEGSVLIVSRVGVGKVAVAPRTLCTSQDFTNIRNVKGYPLFLAYQMSLRMGLEAKNTQGTSIKGIPMTEIKMYKLLQASYLEQQKIADFLCTIDSRITNQSSKLDSLQELKKGVMQKIFSQEIRFKREDGGEYPEWEEMSIASLGTFYNGLSGKSKKDFSDGNKKYITYMNVFKNSIANPDDVSFVKINENEKQNIVGYGDVIFTQSSETVEEVGMSSVWMGDEEVYLNSFCFGFRPSSHSVTLPEYLAQVLRSGVVRSRIMMEGHGTTRINLSSARLGNVEIPIPKSIEEQQKIADFLSTLDSKISLESQILETLQTLKKGLLQQMFV